MSRNFLQVFEAKSYDGEGSRNPLFRRRRQLQRYAWPIFFLSLFLAGVVVLGWLIYGPKLRLSTVEIVGATTLDRVVLEDAVRQELKRYVMVLPRNHQWIFSDTRLSQKLLQDFPLQAVTLEPQGQKLKVTVVEDVMVIALRSAEVVAFLDRGGKVLRLADPLEIVAVASRVGEVTPTPEEQGSLPLLPTSLPIIRTVDPVSMDLGVELYDDLVMENLIIMDGGLRGQGIAVKEYVTENVHDAWFKVTSDLPYEIYFDAEHDIAEQLLLLRTVMSEFKDSPPLHYLDVRFGDRVFVR